MPGAQRGDVHRPCLPQRETGVRLPMHVKEQLLNEFVLVSGTQCVGGTSRYSNRVKFIINFLKINFKKIIFVFVNEHFPCATMLSWYMRYIKAIILPYSVEGSERTFHNETLLYPGLDDAHEGRCEWKVLGEDKMQQYVRDVQFAQICRQLTFRVDLVQPHVPFEQVVAY